jgi:hypothetical protein
MSIVRMGEDDFGALNLVVDASESAIRDSILELSGRSFWLLTVKSGPNVEING